MKNSKNLNILSAHLWNQAGGSTIFPWPETRQMKPVPRSTLNIFMIISENVGNIYNLHFVKSIHSKSEKIGGVYSSAQKYWRKNCVNGGDKNA